MAKKALPSPEVLRQLLHYEPEAGKLFWKERGLEWFGESSDRWGGVFSSASRAKAWNTSYAGREAFTALCAGYPHGNLLGEKYLAHRVAWVWMHGSISGEIDHIDGNRRNFSIANLREVDRSGNMKNTAISAKNTSGHVGVSWCRITEKWRAGVHVAGRHICLGRYKDMAEAVAARKLGEEHYGFHANHGRTAP